MKPLIQAGHNGCVPMPPEKRFLIRTILCFLAFTAFADPLQPLVPGTNRIAFSYPTGIGASSTNTWQEWPHLDGSGFAIITTDAIAQNSSNVNAFIVHKKSFGYDVTLVTETTQTGGGAGYGNLIGQPPNGTAQRVRQWLVNSYIQLDLRYVLLIGNPDPDDPTVVNDPVGDIPMLGVAQPGYSDGLIYDGGATTGSIFAATDLYYADLSGNWDLDGDGYYAESATHGYYGTGHDFGAGGVDVVREVYVGRIPVYAQDYATLDHILNKIMDEENAPGCETGEEWRDRTLMLDFNHGSGWPLAMRDEIFQRTEVGAHIHYREEWFDPYVHVPGSDRPFDDDAVRWDLWNRGYGTIILDNHGSPHGIHGILSIYDLDNLRQDRPFVSYVHACAVAMPEVTNNLAYKMLATVAIGVVGGSRNVGGSASWTDPGSSFFIGYHFLDYVAHGRSLGEALWDSKQAWTTSHSFRQILELNLYGDPSFHKGSHENIVLRNAATNTVTVSSISNEAGCAEVMRTGNLPVTLGPGEDVVVSLRVNRGVLESGSYQDIVHVVTDTGQDVTVAVDVVIDDLPDLVALPEYIPDPLDPLTAGDTITVMCTVTNIGTAAAVPSELALFIGCSPTDHSRRIAATNLGAMAVQGGVDVDFRYTLTDADLVYVGGARSIYLNLQVDEQDEVRERWEDNNRWSEVLSHRARYVTTTGAGLRDGSSWSNAMGSIQAAIDVSQDGDHVLVGDGYYTNGTCVNGLSIMPNRIAVSNAIVVRSLNGPEQTFIVGSAATSSADACGNGVGAIRCASVSGGGALRGFTLQDGHTMTVGAVSVYNDKSGGGAFLNGGTLRDCIVQNCSGSWYGGGVSLRSSGATIYNCIIRNNCAVSGGGGIYAISTSIVDGNLLYSNEAHGNQGGAFFGGYATLRNCTVVSNRCAGTAAGGVYARNLVNCIVYYNEDIDGGDDEDVRVNSGGACQYTCTPAPAGVGNISAVPVFVDRNSADFRLAETSPCIDTGTNLLPDIVVDVAGMPRPLDGDLDGAVAFDIGACEFDPRVRAGYFAETCDIDGDGMLDGWENDNGLDVLRVDATENPDGDRYDNYHEFIALTCPTNDEEFVVGSIACTDSAGGVVIRWKAGLNRLYSVYSSTDLAQPSWATNLYRLPGIDGIMSHTNDGAVMPMFFRLGVELGSCGRGQPLAAVGASP